MSDLCTLGSRPGMECVPLRSPADPYHYHHVTDQTKSLQELQNEVGALLEFRDLVIETFPDLKTKMASSAANSTLTGIPSASSLASRREWEPGIRTRRKLTLTQKEAVAAAISASASAEIHHHSANSVVSSSSLLIRSRSNSHSGSGHGSSGGVGHNKKEPKSAGQQSSSAGDGQSGSSVVIQDSGFSTETSSSKETHSASSSTGGGVQGTIVSNTPNRLTVDTEDELWNLLDVIHRKSNRLREEVDALQQLEREKCRTTATATTTTNLLINNSNNNNHTNIVTSSSSNHSNSSSSNNNNKNSSSNSDSSSNKSGNLPHHGTTPLSGLTKTFQNQLLVDVVNKDDVQILRKERDRLFDKLSEYEAEAIAGRIRASKMQDEVDALASAKRDLEDQLKAALSQKLELNSKIHDLHQQYVNKSAPSSPESIKGRQVAAHGHFRKHSSSDSTATTIVIGSSQLSSSPSSTTSTTTFHHPHQPSKSQQHFSQSSSSFAPVKKVIPHPSTDHTQYQLLHQESRSSSAGSTSEDRLQFPAAVSGELQLGKLDGLISSPARLNKVRMLDSKRISAILLETNIVELQRHLLTITVQNQILQQRLESATRYRISFGKKWEKSKEDIEDLKFQLEERTIELEGTKAQLRILEAKQSGGGAGIGGSNAGSKSSVSSSSGFSPEHHGVAAKMVTTSAGGIVSHRQTTSTSELSSPVHHHQPTSNYHHQQQQQRDLTLRLQQSQVSTPSMKAMIPLAMDEVLHHSSSTESAQDQAEREVVGGGLGGGVSKLQCPETPRRRPSKIPLPGTKGYVAPKPPTGRNFVAGNTTSGTRQEKSSPSPSGSLTNKSLNKSTGSLYLKSVGPSSITSANRKDISLNRPESAQSWRREASLEKSRSSSIPVSKGSPVSKTIGMVPLTTVVSSSPQPKAKRDSLTTRVKNLDSLSRYQSASASTGNLSSSKSNSKKDLSSSFTTGQLRDRKQSASTIRRVSSASIGRNVDGSSIADGSSGGNNSTSSNSGSVADNGKARRTNTFRLAKPTLMPPAAQALVGLSVLTAPTNPRICRLPIPPLKSIPRHPMVLSQQTKSSVQKPPLRRQTSSISCSSGSSSSGSSSSSTTTGGSSPSSVTTITTVGSQQSSSSVGQPIPAARDLIGEYLAAKNRSPPEPPAIFSPPKVSHSTSNGGNNVEAEANEDEVALAYKHPILLMNDEDDEPAFCSVVSSVGKERNREMEVKFVDDNSIELLDAGTRGCDEVGEGEKESLIVPRPKMIAFHSLKSSVENSSIGEVDPKGRLVGKVNPNILKTWEQLSGGVEKGCEEQNRKSSLITVTSSENSADSKQSCLLFCPNQYNLTEEPSEFRVTRVRHNSASSNSTTVADERNATTASVSMATTSTTTTETSSEGCYDFYDSIDDDGASRLADFGAGRIHVEDDDEYDALAAGEGMAEFTSLDRTKFMWSIDVE
ncbi:uncharacterized protein LOC129739162 isoform X2 [Uranotaenia lowii]|uniref:uncharacterized protein LOC129739162 isoform X2 n=1 Tax=Uranotaenia lowii TaxID=190385 RepID=UPI002479E4C7|nr:uncharacterized protein LOC129739162 isoform X2 [Uranotaenia lowii]